MAHSCAAPAPSGRKRRRWQRRMRRAQGIFSLSPSLYPAKSNKKTCIPDARTGFLHLISRIPRLLCAAADSAHGAVSRVQDWVQALEEVPP
eukprot:2516637-Rhodomonas_salina.1